MGRATPHGCARCQPGRQVEAQPLAKITRNAGRGARAEGPATNAAAAWLLVMPEASFPYFPARANAAS